MFTFWQVSTFGTLIVYGVLYDWRILCIWFTFFLVYVALGEFYSSGKDNRTRAKIRMATWDPPTEGNCYVKIEVNLTKADEFIKKKSSGEVKVTYTHIALKAIGLAFKQSQRTCGKIVFGRFVPLEDVDIFTLVDVEGGKDLAGLCVKKCDKLNIPQIADQLKGKVSKIKTAKDATIKKQTGAASLLPSVLVQLISQAVSFITYNLNLPIPPLNFEPNHFGTILLTNVSSMPGFYEVSILGANTRHTDRSPTSPDPWLSWSCALQKNERSWRRARSKWPR